MALEVYQRKTLGYSRGIALVFSTFLEKPIQSASARQQVPKYVRWADILFCAEQLRAVSTVATAVGLVNILKSF